VTAEAPRTAPAFLPTMQAFFQHTNLTVTPQADGAEVYVAPAVAKPPNLIDDRWLNRNARKLEDQGYDVQRLFAASDEGALVTGLVIRQKEAPLVAETRREHTLILRIHPLAAAALDTLTPVQYHYAEAAAIRGLRDYLVGLDLLPPVAPLAEGQALTLTFPGPQGAVELPVVVVRASHALPPGQRSVLSGPYTTFRYTRPDDTTGEVTLLDATLPTFVKGA
jgi:hypothetical protein